jgi:DNA-binding transcriptional MerR regulator
MRIGELARRTGVSERMLRYYEEEGLLRPTRTAAGYRSYEEADALAAERIRLLSASGLKLDAVRVLLPCMQEGGPGFQPCEEVRQALRRELGKLDEKLQELARSRSIVARFLAGLDG